MDYNINNAIIIITMTTINIGEETEYRIQREKEIRESLLDYYPHTFQITMRFEEYINKYSHIDAGSHHPNLIESLAGRIQEKRRAGKHLFFYTVTSDGKYIQYLVHRQTYGNADEFDDINKLIHRGDIVGVTGIVGKSKNGELSIFSTHMVILTPCFKFMPKLNFGLKDAELRARKRYLNLIVNPSSHNIFTTRASVFRSIRKYLDNMGFIEVNTPILSSVAGGAIAKPFITHHNDLDQDMYMRIAPELFLKELVVGGITRVYEIGPQFRNESITPKHNPEFTSLEFYMAYIDYYCLMDMCESMITNIISSLHDTLKITYLDKTIDFSTPYRRIDMMDELKNKTGISFPTDLSTDDSLNFIDSECIRLDVECAHPRTMARLLDKLVETFIEPDCINPTFICNHPIIMSPLAKHHRDNNELCERFELFVNGMELANAYTELNNHVTQRERFLQQQSDKEMGDQEAHPLDDSFIDALEYGLPPCGGFGLGLDRFIMILTNNRTIKDVIPFPQLAIKK